ncbi:MAG: hypothetical protein O2783_08180 [Chloroflexi bacterium]|nr:hypothetical protein [Chloroflexota bacterium]
MMDEEALHAAYELGRYDASKLLRKAHKAENESLRNVVEAVAAEIRSLASEFDEENKEGPAGLPADFLRAQADKLEGVGEQCLSDLSEPR